MAGGGGAGMKASVRPCAAIGLRGSREPGSSTGWATGIAAAGSGCEVGSGGGKATTGTSAGAGVAEGEAADSPVCGRIAAGFGGVAVTEPRAGSAAATVGGPAVCGAGDSGADVSAATLAGSAEAAIEIAIPAICAIGAEAGAANVAAGAWRGICGRGGDALAVVCARRNGTGIDGAPSSDTRVEGTGAANAAAAWGGICGRGGDAWAGVCARGNGTGIEGAPLRDTRVNDGETPSGFSAAGRSVGLFGRPPGSAWGARETPSATSGGMGFGVTGTISPEGSRASGSGGGSPSPFCSSFTRSFSVAEKFGTSVTMRGEPAVGCREEPAPGALGLSPADFATTTGREGCEANTVTRQTIADWWPATVVVVSTDGAGGGDENLPEPGPAA